MVFDKLELLSRHGTLLSRQESLSHTVSIVYLYKAGIPVPSAISRLDICLLSVWINSWVSGSIPTELLCWNLLPPWNSCHLLRDYPAGLENGAVGQGFSNLNCSMYLNYSTFNYSTASTSDSTCQLFIKPLNRWIMWASSGKIWTS